MGSNGLDMVNNTLSHLNESSHFRGSVRRWYCHGSCSGRFASVAIPDSLLATLKGCVLRIFPPLREPFSASLARTDVGCLFRRWLQLRFDCHSTALRPFDDLHYDQPFSNDKFSE